MEIYFNKHAEEKFDILLKHKFKINKSQVIQTIIRARKNIDYSKIPLLIAQRKIDKTHYLIKGSLQKRK